MKVTYANAIGDALKEEMRRDGKVLIYGEDIAQFGEGENGVTVVTLK